MINNIKIEICCGSINDCLKAINYPIDRLELNSAIELGGLTPSLSTLKEVKKKTKIPVCCMVRCRKAGFCYNDQELDVMYNDALLLLENGADGIVFGFLNSDHTINELWTSKFVSLIHSYHKEAIFHKAFDAANNLVDAANKLIELKVDRILTSGGFDSEHIIDGAKVIGKLNQEYQGLIEFLPGGGVRVNNIQDVIKLSNSKQIHMTSKKEYLDGKEFYYGLDENQLVELIANIKLIEDNN